MLSYGLDLKPRCGATSRCQARKQSIHWWTKLDLVPFKWAVLQESESWSNRSDSRLHWFSVSHQSDGGTCSGLLDWFRCADHIRCVDVAWAHLWVSGWSGAPPGVPGRPRRPPLLLTAHGGRVRTAAVDWRQFTVSPTPGVEKTLSRWMNKKQWTQGRLSSSPSLHISIHPTLSLSIPSTHFTLSTKEVRTEREKRSIFSVRSAPQDGWSTETPGFCTQWDPCWPLCVLHRAVEDCGPTRMLRFVSSWETRLFHELTPTRTATLRQHCVQFKLYLNALIWHYMCMCFAWTKRCTVGKLFEPFEQHVFLYFYKKYKKTSFCQFFYFGTKHSGFKRKSVYAFFQYTHVHTSMHTHVCR